MTTYRLAVSNPVGLKRLPEPPKLALAACRELQNLGVKQAITLWPEWAWAICHLDKMVENRTWPPPKAVVGTRIAIHAGAHVGGRKGEPARREGTGAMLSMAVRAGWTLSEVFVREHEQFIELRKGAPPVVEFTPSAIVTSAIVAHALLARIDEPQEVGEHGGWYIGEYGWRLEDVVVLPEPIPMQGAQGLWGLP